MATGCKASGSLPFALVLRTQDEVTTSKHWDFILMLDLVNKTDWPLVSLVHTFARRSFDLEGLSREVAKGSLPSFTRPLSTYQQS